MSKPHIARIAGMNVKGRSFTHDLAELTALVGPNASGKTSIADAIMVAAQGYHPAIGRQPKATMTLAPDAANQMEVQATFSTGASVRRTFTRTRTGASLETVGATLQTAGAQLHFGDFIAAKPTERHAILNSLMATPDYDAMTDRAKAFLASKGLAWRPGFSMGEQYPIDNVIANLAEEAKAMRQSIDTARKAIGQLSATSATPNVVSATQIEEASAAYHAAVAAEATTAQTLNRLSDRQQLAPERPIYDKPTDDHHAALTETLTEAETALATARGQRMGIGAMQETARNLKGRCSALIAATNEAPETDPGITSAAARAALESARSEFEATRRISSDLNSAKLRAQDDSANYAKQIADLGTKGTCPCCGTTGHALEAAMEAMLERQSKLVANEQKAALEVDAAVDNLAAKSEQVEAAKAAASLAAAWEAKQQYDEAATQLLAVEKAIADLPDISDLEQNEMAARTAFSESVTTRGEWEQYDRYDCPSESQIQQARTDWKIAVEAKEIADKRMSDLRQSRSEYDLAVAEQRRIQEMDHSATVAEAERTKLLEFREFLIGEQRAATAEAMKPLMKVAGIFLKGMLNGEMAVRDHLVGIQRGAQFLPIEVLSGMETVAVAAACQAALATTAELPILIVDELARMTPANRRQFSDNCAEAITIGVVSQVILIDQTADAHPQAKVIICQ